MPKSLKENKFFFQKEENKTLLNNEYPLPAFEKDKTAIVLAGDVN